MSVQRARSAVSSYWVVWPEGKGLADPEGSVACDVELSIVHACGVTFKGQQFIPTFASSTTKHTHTYIYIYIMYVYIYIITHATIYLSIYLHLRFYGFRAAAPHFSVFGVALSHSACDPPPPFRSNNPIYVFLYRADSPQRRTSDQVPSKVRWKGS